MLRSIIVDAYRQHEKQQIVDALNDLCSPTDTYGWSSAGVYCYWDYYTREVYYIGLTTDLTERFKQHNDFYSSISNTACKKQQINKYFDKKEKLGFSIIVQSPLSQPITTKVNEKYNDFFTLYPPAHHYVGEDGRETIKRQEGSLLETFKMIKGRLPLWNKANGSIKGQQAAKPALFDSIQVLCNLKEHELLSRSSLRELSQSSTFQAYEDFLHGVRILTSIMGYQHALQFQLYLDTNGTYQRMVNTGYLNKVLSI